MMKLSPMDAPQTGRDLMNVFGGYNAAPSAAENEFSDILNMCADRYPVLATRPPRGVPTEVISSGSQIYSAVGGDTIYFVRSDGLWRWDSGRFSLLSDDGPHIFPENSRLIQMGAYLIVFPTWYWYHTETKEKGLLSAELNFSGTVSDAVLAFPTVSNAPIEKIANTRIGGEKPSGTPFDGDFWLDTSDGKNTLKRYSEMSAEWGYTVPDAAALWFGMDNAFRVGDVVEFSGFSEEYAALNGYHYIYDMNSDLVVIDAQFTGKFMQCSGAVTVTRRPPENMDGVIEHENRLWGYSNSSREIYCSRLGDPFNWRDYKNGISQEAYAATVPGDSDFTAAASYNGCVYFFKSGTVYRLYGNQPSNFQLVSLTLPGVVKGGENGLVQIGGYLYYPSPDGIYCFNGESSRRISDAFSGARYRVISAGEHRGKYYLCLLWDSASWSVMSYDPIRSIWHKETPLNERVLMAKQKDELFLFWRPESGKYLFQRLGEQAGTGSVEWYAESTRLTLTQPDSKYLIRLQLRAAFCGEIRVSVSYDDGPWITLRAAMSDLSEMALTPFVLSVRPRRCNYFRLRFEGSGAAELYSICKTVEYGSANI